MRILIVDDERCYGSLLASCCKKLGHRTRLAASAADAIELLRRERVDAAFIDLIMPATGGLELAARLRAEGQTVPLAFCTGTAGDHDVAAAAAIGPVLPKVWTVADVRAALDSLTRRARERDEEPAQRQARGSAPPEADAVGTASPPAVPTARPPRRARVLAAGSGANHVLVPRQPRGPDAPARVAHGSTRLPLERVRVSCRTWDRLRRLCKERLDGRRGITVRVGRPLAESASVDVVLELPDEMTVILRGQVVGEGAQVGDRREFRIDLVGFDPQYARRLLALAESHGASAPAAERAATDRDTPLHGG